MNKNSEPLDNSDVVSTTNELCEGKGLTLKISQILSGYSYELRAHWRKNILYDGIECEVLKTDGGGWRKGKIKFQIVFEPDEPEVENLTQSPDLGLDDIRQSIS